MYNFIYVPTLWILIVLPVMINLNVLINSYHEICAFSALSRARDLYTWESSVTYPISIWNLSKTKLMIFLHCLPVLRNTVSWSWLLPTWLAGSFPSCLITSYQLPANPYRFPPFSTILCTKITPSVVSCTGFGPTENPVGSSYLGIPSRTWSLRLRGFLPCVAVGALLHVHLKLSIERLVTLCYLVVPGQSRLSIHSERKA